MADPITVSEFDSTTGCITVTYDTDYFSDVSYDSTTGEITFTYNSDKITSFVYVLLNGRKYNVTYTYEQVANTLLNIEGYDVPYPSSYKMTSTTLVDSGRNSQGIVVSNLVREGIRKLELTWKWLSAQNLQDIMSIIENNSFKLNVVYYDTILGDFSSKEFYSGDRVSISAKQSLDVNGKIVGYENVKISLVEV